MIIIKYSTKNYSLLLLKLLHDQKVYILFILYNIPILYSITINIKANRPKTSLLYKLIFFIYYISYLYFSLLTLIFLQKFRYFNFARIIYKLNLL